MRRDLIALPDDSKVWIYAADAKIPEEDAELIKERLYDFTMKWQSHGTEVDCYGHLFHNRFIVLVADESNLPSGCSIDSSVHFIQALGHHYRVDFFNRLVFSYLQNDEVHTIHKSQLKDAFNDKKIGLETLMFDHLVKTKKAFLEEWIIPLKDSWYMKWIR